MTRALALLLALASPASAGCEDFATTPKETFREIDARRGTFLMAVGSFFEGVVLDEIFALTAEGSETSTRIVASRFAGHSAAPGGFTVKFEVDLQVAQRCDNADCHPRLDGTRYLVFLERFRGRYRFAEDGCALRAFENPSEAALNGVVSCLNGACQ